MWFSQIETWKNVIGYWIWLSAWSIELLVRIFKYLAAFGLREKKCFSFIKKRRRRRKKKETLRFFPGVFLPCVDVYSCICNYTPSDLVTYCLSQSVYGSPFLFKESWMPFSVDLNFQWNRMFVWEGLPCTDMSNFLTGGDSWISQQFLLPSASFSGN